MNKKRLFMLFVIGVVVATMMVVAVGSRHRPWLRRRARATEEEVTVPLGHGLTPATPGAIAARETAMKVLFGIGGESLERRVTCLARRSGLNPISINVLLRAALAALF